MRRETGPQNGLQGRIEVTQPVISSQLHSIRSLVLLPVTTLPPICRGG